MLAGATLGTVIAWPGLSGVSGLLSATSVSRVVWNRSASASIASA